MPQSANATENAAHMCYPQNGYINPKSWMNDHPPRWENNPCFDRRSIPWTSVWTKTGLHSRNVNPHVPLKYIRKHNVMGMNWFNIIYITLVVFPIPANKIYVCIYTYIHIYIHIYIYIYTHHITSYNQINNNLLVLPNIMCQNFGLKKPEPSEPSEP